MDEFIYKCYEDFKNFMCLDSNSLPDITPKLINQPDDITGKYPCAYINGNEIGNNPINLYYDITLPNYKMEYIKGVLFHEFTHIMDGIVLKENYPYNKFIELMKTYSEYHAVQIELGCKVGFRNIHSCHKINLDKTFVYHQNEKVKITSDYIANLADVAKIIEQPTDFYYNLPYIEYYRNYNNFFTKTMYYLGKRDFCKKYSFIQIKNITQKTYGEFYPFIHTIESSIQNKIFDNIIEENMALFYKYLSTFKLKEDELRMLIKELNL